MGGRSKSSRREEKASAPFAKIIIGAVASSVLYFIILAVFSAVAINSGISASSYMPAGMAAGAVTGFAGGFIAVRPIKEKGILYGLISGAVQALICSVVLFAVNGMSAGNGIFVLGALILLFSVFGGISAVNLKIKKKY
ncbi:MAG: TIGR04086 family membrane protein [Clostridia bacterium]|nr:TIGR04086 family membrane protein [Clostridia bacterium]